MKPSSLRRQVVLSMTAVAFGGTLLVVAASYAFYFMSYVYWPEIAESASLLPSVPEWIMLLVTTVLVLAMAGAVAIRLARRILLPLNSVAEAIGRVAQGDLAARASAGDRSLGEAARLADDFNSLAGQLQRMTAEQAFWNAAIAHELRTPVTILRGRLQGLAEGVFEPSEGQFRSLLAQVEGLTRLIEDLRVVSLAESGHLDLQWRDTDVAAEIGEVVDLFRDALAAAGQSVMLELGAGNVRCDPARIRQALLALLENARKHAVPGALRVGCRVDKGHCQVYVEDSGPGIPAEAATDVFRAFRRLGNPGGAGSGLGLAVVAAIAHAHGGTAGCAPAAGGGTRFTFEWPAG